MCFPPESLKIAHLSLNAKLLQQNMIRVSCIRQFVETTDWKLHSLWSFARNCVNCRATFTAITTNPPPPPPSSPPPTATTTTQTTTAPTNTTIAVPAINGCWKNESLSLNVKRIENNRWSINKICADDDKVESWISKTFPQCFHHPRNGFCPSALLFFVSI